MDKGFTIGIGSAMMAVFGLSMSLPKQRIPHYSPFSIAFIPYPIIFGSIVDSSCMIWESKCGKTGNCWLYDQTKFRRYLHGGSITFMAIGSLFDFLMIFFSDRVKDFYGDKADAAVEEKKPVEKTELSTINPAYQNDEPNGNFVGEKKI